MTKHLWRILVLSLLTLALTACAAAPADSGSAEYEAQTIEIRGLPDGDKLISVAELRALEQHDLDASYKRTTGMIEEFQMSGPYLADVLASLGGDLGSYAGIGVMGTDGYYCLVDEEIIAATPDMMLAVLIDGAADLGEGVAPARLAVQGQFGPYWVKMVDSIILYDEIPEKRIANVWLFDNLVEGIEPYYYEYYGSADRSYELNQIFTRFDNVLSTAFFTMKSSDGFKKNEAISMLLSDYYIKVEGDDAPTNISPHVQLGMNVQHIAWFSTNADAAIFPEELGVYMENAAAQGLALPLSEICFEVGMEQVEGLSFELYGMDGERYTVSGEELYQGLLVVEDDGRYSVSWPDELAYAPISDLLRIRLVEDGGAADETAGGGQAAAGGQTQAAADTLLEISGDGVGGSSYWSMADLQALSGYQAEAVYSTHNNWPTEGSISGKGVALYGLLQEAGLRDNAASVRLIASDGFAVTLTMQQVRESRYTYPSGAEVPAIVAWAYGEGAASPQSQLRFLIGQIAPSEVNTSAMVEKLCKIEVSTSGGGRWAAPAIDVVEGSVPAGTPLSFVYENMDLVKIYYTTDGSQPTHYSAVYNPSTSYFQPHLTTPLIIDADLTLKAFASGWGRADSETVSFSFSVE
ncbi:MAG: FN3 associated domain-containing protein [Bacillota bacterium]|nr:FN3 associated domain-containing protein [Bacillota bacterium]